MARRIIFFVAIVLIAIIAVKSARIWRSLHPGEAEITAELRETCATRERTLQFGDRSANGKFGTIADRRASVQVLAMRKSGDVLHPYIADANVTYQGETSTRHLQFDANVGIWEWTP